MRVTCLNETCGKKQGVSNYDWNRGKARCICCGGNVEQTKYMPTKHKVKVKRGKMEEIDLSEVLALFGLE